MGAQNLNPFEELKNLDRQVDLVTDLAALKPIFYRLDEIAKENPSDFEVQLVVGDIKQHLVNRGSRLKEQQQAPPPPPLPPNLKATPPAASGPAAAPPASPPPAPPPDLKPTRKLMSSGQFVTKPVAPEPPATRAVPPTPAAAPPQAAPPVAKVPPPLPPQAAPPVVKVPPPPSAPAPRPPVADVSTGQAPPTVRLSPPRPAAQPTGSQPTGSQPPGSQPPGVPPAGAAPPQTPRQAAPVPTEPAVPAIAPTVILPRTQGATPPVSPGPIASGPASVPPPEVVHAADAQLFAEQPPIASSPVEQPPAAERPLAPPPKPPQQARPPGPPAPPNWRRTLVVGGISGAIVAVALIAILVSQARKRNHRPTVTLATVQVDITTTPAGASIRIAPEQTGASPAGAEAPETKCTSNCKVDLAPGSYQVTAFLDGFQPATSSLTVAAGQPALVDLALMAQAQSVRILTDLDQGKVAFDDQPAVDLQEGQLVLDDVKPGAHTVKLTSRNSTASFSFEIAEAKPPAVTGPVTARNLAAVLVSSFGTQARVVTNSGPLKLALNGQPQGDVGPEGVDLKDFQAGVDELVVGEGKDQRNVKESFGPAPMLTAFLKSDVNAGTLIVSTGEDEVRVFVNNKEYRQRTKRGQVRIQTLGDVSVRVAKDGFQEEPVQTAEVKKGSEVRLEFKLKAAPQLGAFLIRGGTAGAEVLLDQKSVGTVNADGGFTDNTVPPGDHVIEIRRDQYASKRFQRTIKAGQIVLFTGADAVLAVSNGTIRLARMPTAAAVTYHRADEAETHDLRGNQVELPPGVYVFSAKAPGFADHTERVQLTAGETRTLEINLVRERAKEVPEVTAGIGDFEDPSAWKKEGELWKHKGGGFIPFKMTPKGVFTFTVELLKGGNVFRGGRIRWALQYVDAKNYLLFELDKKTFWAEVVENGKKLEREKTQHDLEKQKAFTIEIDVAPDRLIHKVREGDDWTVLDSFSEPGRNFTQGKFAFLIQGNDEIGISDFKFTPK